MGPSISQAQLSYFLRDFMFMGSTHAVYYTILNKQLLLIRVLICSLFLLKRDHHLVAQLKCYVLHNFQSSYEYFIYYKSEDALLIKWSYRPPPIYVDY